MADDYATWRPQAEADWTDEDIEMLRRERDAARAHAEHLRTVLATVEHRLIEVQHDADAYGAVSLGTKIYALRQFVRNYSTEQTP